MNNFKRPTTSFATSSRFRSRASLTAAATFAASASAISTAHAGIIWSGALDESVNTSSTTPDSVLLDFNLNGQSDPLEAVLVGHSTYYTGNTLGLSGNTSSKSSSNAFLYQDAPVSAGSTIDASLNYVDQHSYLNQDGSTILLAFDYQPAMGPYYGWAEITLSADGTTGTLDQWAYNDVAGGSILAGETGAAVPEPSNYVLAFLCVLAAGGIALLRRRRGA